MLMRADIIVVSYNTRDYLRRCLDSIRLYAGAARLDRTIVVDNCSGDGSQEMVREEFPWVELIALEENIGFGAANNRAMAAGDAPLLLFLNPDAELRPGALDSLCRCMDEHPDCVIAGPELVNPDGSFQKSARRFPSFLRNLWCYSGMEGRTPKSFHSLHNWLSEDEHREARAVDMVSGACFIARRLYLESIGLFDENLFMYEEETDISLPAARQGREIRFCPQATVVHLGGASIHAAQLADFALYHMFRSKYYAFRKHYGSLTARATYASDQVIFLSSILRNSLRPNLARVQNLRNQSRKAWRSARKVKRRS